MSYQSTISHGLFHGTPLAGAQAEKLSAVPLKIGRHSHAIAPRGWWREGVQVPWSQVPRSPRRTGHGYSGVSSSLWEIQESTIKLHTCFSLFFLVFPIPYCSWKGLSVSKNLAVLVRPVRENASRHWVALTALELVKNLAKFFTRWCSNYSLHRVTRQKGFKVMAQDGTRCRHRRHIMDVLWDVNLDGHLHGARLSGVVANAFTKFSSLFLLWCPLKMGTFRSVVPSLQLCSCYKYSTAKGLERTSLIPPLMSTENGHIQKCCPVATALLLLQT